MTGAEQRASLAASGVPWHWWEGGEKERVCVARSGHLERVVRRYGQSGGDSVRLSLSQYLSLSMRAERGRCLEDYLLLWT